MSESLKSEALRYAAMGLEVFPVALDKQPLVPHGHKDATTDPKRIHTLWRVYPGAQIAARCTNFWVLDVDPINGGRLHLNKWLNLFGPLPHTWTQETGSRGQHYFFQHSPALDAVPLGKLRDGIDVKGGGRGYILLAPSRNLRGPYRWIADPRNTRLAKAPEWLVNLIVQAKRPARHEPIQLTDKQVLSSNARISRALSYASKLNPSISGSGGHNAAMRAAVMIARGFDLSEDEAFAVLAREFNPRCQPPWSAEELRRKVREALRVGSMTIGSLLPRGNR